MSNTVIHLNRPVDPAVVQVVLDNLMATDGFMLRCVHAACGPTWVASIGPDTGFGASLQDTLANLAVAQLNRQATSPVTVQDNRPVLSPRRLEICRLLTEEAACADRVEDLAEELQELVDSVRCGDVSVADMATISAEIIRVTQRWTEASTRLAEVEAQIDVLDPDHDVRNSL